MSMDKDARCRNCEHFSAGGNTQASDFGTCEKWEYGYHSDITKIPKNELLVENDEGWGAWIGPEFGCVLFERSDKT